jgi:alpha-D-xyloside xylohydrolase
MTVLWLLLTAAGSQACTQTREKPPLVSADANAEVDLQAGPIVLPAPQAGFELHSGDARLIGALDGDVLVLTLAMDQNKRAGLRTDLLRFGRVQTWDPERNYSPTNLALDPPGDLDWLHVASWAHQPHPLPVDIHGFAPKEGMTVLLHTADAKSKPGPDFTLACDAVDLGRFACDLHLAAAELREQTAKDLAPQPIVYAGLGLQVDPAEGYYGLGEFFDTPQHRGKVRPLQLEADLNLDGSSNEGHVRVPLLVGTKGWGLFVESLRPGQMDVGAAKADRVEALFMAADMRFWLLAAAKPIDVPGLYTRLTGAPAVPAQWAFGTLIWRNENDDTAEVLADMQAIRDQDLAISGMWLDRPFDVAVNDFGFDPKKFPDPKAMVAQVQALGFRMGEWSTPYLDPGPDKPKAQHHDEAAKNGFFVKTMLGMAASKLQQWGPPIDFTNPAAMVFWKGQVQKAADAGIEGWKLDYGEDIQLGLLTARIHDTFFDGSDERTMHRGYFPLYHRPYAESLPKTGGWLLCRAGSYGGQRYASIIWPGDLCANWTHFGDCDEHGCHAGGLPASVSAAISLPTSGYPLFGADTGGYRHGRPTKELFLRWLGHTALSGILQIGGSSNVNPWDFSKYSGNEYGVSQFDQETLDASRDLIRLHTRLFPYLYTDTVNASLHKGIGPVRALGMMHPSFAEHAGLKAHEADQYYLGDYLLVAPITQPGGKREVWLPPGPWRDWWTHEVVGLADAPTMIMVDLPVTRVPLYVRAGTVIPLLRPTIDTLAPSTVAGVDSFANQAGQLTWLVVPGQGAAAINYDASGAKLSDPGTACGVAQKSLALAINGGSVFGGPAAIELWLDTAPTTVGMAQANGPPTPLPFTYDAATRVLRFEAPNQGTACIGLAK